MSDYKEVTLDNLNKGAIPDLFDEELKKVIRNIADVNTPAKAERKIVIEISFKPSEDRGDAATKIQISSKLARPKLHEGFVQLHNDGSRITAYTTNIRQETLPGMGVENITPFTGGGQNG